jgi:hypothetical protein
MTYIVLTLLSGILSGIVAVWFRLQELKKEVILMHKQLITQIVLFIVFALVFAEFFSEMNIDLGFIQLGWFLIYVLFSSASFYAVQVSFEAYTNKNFFATEEEMQKYIEKLEDEGRF